ncbi:hypothetical protein [Roseimaritima sediminicola]|uniref:hypothetical protein n=1 Tax=Roseimaritima sediminicola TaxID=2662066 RepID=UPI00129843B9|nr:hypothetical protein [Roseimaritima sediminicola]
MNAAPSAPRELRCPACRARQSYRQTCRRCRADLGLLVAALQRVDVLQAEIEQARAAGDHVRLAAHLAELEWLAPKSLPR